MMDIAFACAVRTCNLASFSLQPTEEADWSWHGLIITNSICKGAEFAVNEIDRERQHVGSHLCCHGSL